MSTSCSVYIVWGSHMSAGPLNRVDLMTFSQSEAMWKYNSSNSINNNGYYLPKTIPSTWYELVNLIHTTTLQGLCYCYPHLQKREWVHNLLKTIYQVSLRTWFKFRTEFWKLEKWRHPYNVTTYLLLLSTLESNFCMKHFSFFPCEYESK